MTLQKSSTSLHTINNILDCLFPQTPRREWSNICINICLFNSKYVFCSDLDFLRFSMFYIRYSYFLFCEVSAHIIFLLESFITDT